MAPAPAQQGLAQPENDWKNGVPRSVDPSGPNALGY